MLIENEEIFFIDYERDPTKKIVYIPLRSYLALIKAKVAQAIVNKETSEVKEIFFKRIKIRNLLDMKEIIEQLHNCNPELSLGITDDCNLRCLYCHASAGEEHKKRTMSHEMIDSILENYFNFIKVKITKIVKINFSGGGDAAFDFDKLKYAINRAKFYADQTCSKCEFSMATNGYYGDNVRKYIVENFTNISLSFDGPDFVHNRHRPTANGKASFDMVFNTAKYFYSANLPFAFRATVSDFSINYLKEIVDFFADNFPNKSIGLELLNPFGRALKCSDNRIISPNKKLFADELIKLFKYVENENKPIKILNSASTEYDIIRPVFCSSVGIPNWTVHTNGDIVACGRDSTPEELIFGKYSFEDRKILLDYDKIKNLRNMIVLNYEECKDCFCKYHCAGDCPDRRLSDKSDCESIRSIGEHILNNKISLVS